jgi:hypothetical protein
MPGIIENFSNLSHPRTKEHKKEHKRTNNKSNRRKKNPNPALYQQCPVNSQKV